MAVDINEATVLRYQECRLREKAAPKFINEEVRFLLKSLGSPAGDLIRGSLKEKKVLKRATSKQIGNTCANGPHCAEAYWEHSATSSRPPCISLAILLRDGSSVDVERRSDIRMTQ